MSTPVPGTTRYLCPLECGWHYDVPSPSVERIAALGVTADPAARDLSEAIGSMATQALLLEAGQTETALREHLGTHTALEFARVIHNLRVEVATLREHPASSEEETRMTDNLPEWLHAQLDEDERIARAVEDWSAPWDGQWVADGDNAARTYNRHVLFYGHSAPLKAGLVAHVVEHDPARVLREVEAKREIIRLHSCTAGHECSTLDGNGEIDHCTWVMDSEACTTLRLLALPYADRPGYREEWRP